MNLVISLVFESQTHTAVISEHL